MRYFVIVLALAINVALVKQGVNGQAGGSTDGANGNGTGDTGNSQPGVAGNGSKNASAGAGVQNGGCSVEASGSGSAGGSADGSASADCAIPGAGYTCVITATRMENRVAPENPVAYMNYQVSPTQNLTYFRSVGPADPLLIEGYIFHDDTVYFENDEVHLLNSCAKQPNGTWDFVLIEVVKKSVLLDGDCSVKKGSYMIDQNVGPITVTFPEMIKCGETDLILNAYVASSRGNSKPTWAFQLYFSLQIAGECYED